MKQLMLELGQECDEKPAIPLAEETPERLVELMAEAIVAVHLAQGGDGDE